MDQDSHPPSRVSLPIGTDSSVDGLVTRAGVAGAFAAKRCIEVGIQVLLEQGDYADVCQPTRGSLIHGIWRRLFPVSNRDRADRAAAMQSSPERAVVEGRKMLGGAIVPDQQIARLPVMARHEVFAGDVDEQLVE